MLDIVMCAHTCVELRELHIAPQLLIQRNLEEIVQSPSLGIRLHSFVTHSVLQLSFNFVSFVIRIASTPIHPPLGVFQLVSELGALNLGLTILSQRSSY